jgi:single-stranded-DNA-specific exonuclease
MAAGLTIREENFSAFRDAFQESCRVLLGEGDFEPRLLLDEEITLPDFNWELLRWHELLQPFGQGNPQPLFLARNVEAVKPPVVLKEKHLLLRLRQDGRYQRAIYFGGAENPVPDPPWDVAFRIGSEEYQGELRLQMQVEALRTTAP